MPLSLSRCIGESIIITVPPSTETQEIEVLLNETRIGRARIGIKAPEHIRIRRSELPDLGPSPLQEIRS